MEFKNAYNTVHDHFYYNKYYFCLYKGIYDKKNIYLFLGKGEYHISWEVLIGYMQ